MPGYNALSKTNPTGTTQTLNTMYIPNTWSRQSSNFQQDFDAQAIYGGHYPEYPFRPAEYMQNWSGVRYFQTWDSLGGMWNNNEDYPTEYRKYITSGYASDTAQLLLYRNQPQQYAPAPIAISQYALNTQQVYVGSDFSGGMYG
jgi:hypothetical protein